MELTQFASMLTATLSTATLSTITLSTVALVVEFTLQPTVAQAFTFSTVGNWSNAIGGNVTYTPGAENRASWGQFDPPSGLGFTGSSGTGNFGDVLQLGTLRHFNNPVGFVGSTVPQTLDLTVALTLLIDDQSIAQNFTYTLEVDETPSIIGEIDVPLSLCPYPSVVPCADAVFWQNTIASNTFTTTNGEYTLQLLGFSNTAGGNPVNQFISEEGSTNQTALYGRVVSTAAVPEPATMTGIALAGAGLAAARRRSKKST